MNDDIFRPDGADWIEPARPPVEPTVNVSATDGFAIDGTDGFAIDEGPIETPVEAPSTDPDGMPALSRGRLVATVAAALTGLLVVILVGSSTGPRPVVSDAGVLRTDDSVTTTTGPVESTPEGAWTRSLLGLWGSTAFAPVYEFDESGEFATDYETVPYDTVYPTEFETDFDSQFDTSFDTDFEDSGTFTYNTIPPRRLPVFSTPSRTRFPPPRRLLPTTPPSTDPETTATTAPATTAPATTAPATTAPATTAPATTAPATTAPPTREWIAARSGLPVECPEGTRLFVRTEGLVAAVPAHGLFGSTDGGSAWTPLGAADEGTGSFAALVQDPTKAGRYWVAGAEGVFVTENADAKPNANFRNLGLTDVQALGVHVAPNDGPITLLAVHGPQASVSRLANGDTVWSPVTLPPGAGSVEDLLVLDTGEALIGTNTGVYRMDAKGVVDTTPEHIGGIVGAPVPSADRESASWLTPDGHVIRRSTTEPGRWDRVPGTGTPVSHLWQLPDGELLAVGSPGLVVLESGGWEPFGPALPYPPAGLVRSDDATFIWKTIDTPGDCGVDAVMRLDDV